MADYDPTDGRFTVPARMVWNSAREVLHRRCGNPPRRRTRPTEGVLEAEKRTKPIRDDTNFLAASFGEKTSPFVGDITLSTIFTLDMARPAD
jgi:hypothetical protein